jgi:hypothetical protein
MNYEKMNIGQLENAVRTALSDYKSGIIAATKTLRYLQKTNRYKENTRYAKEPFKAYLEDQYGIRFGTYMGWVKALPYEKEAEIFGVGLVSKTVSICGAKGARRAFSEISALEEVKKKSVPREKIDTIIAKHTDPKRKEREAENVRTDWKAQYIAERDAHQRTKTALRNALETIEQQADQIAKLKRSAGMMLEVKKIFSEKDELELVDKF